MSILNHQKLHLFSPRPPLNLDDISLVEINKVNDTLTVSINDKSHSVIEWIREFVKSFGPNVNKVGDNMVEITSFSKFYNSDII